LIRTRLAFSIGMFDEGSEKHEDDEYMAIFRAYQTEQSVLEDLYKAKVISQYVYLRMNDARTEMQESLRMGKTAHKALRESNRKSLFARVEGYLLRYSRERPWLASLLSRYQLLRLVQQIERHIAKVIISNEIIEMLRHEEDLELSVREKLTENYSARQRFYRKELDNAERQFSGFFHRNMEQTAHRSMIHHGWQHVEKQYAHGEIGAKGYNIIKHKVELELDSINSFRAVRAPESSESITDMLGQVSLFDSLSSEDRQDLETQATDITFLAGDVIVGESEHGDNFYILIHGTAAVLKLNDDGSSQQLTEFNDGEIIGESSLLDQEKGRHRRSATIVARSACNLISISHKAMLGIVGKYPEIREKMQLIHDKRINGDTEN
jgi:cation transport regulator ChaB